jgi:hypothetical protein
MNIIQTFLDLTNKTYPHGTEHLLEPFLPKDISMDKFGNYFYLIGDNPRSIFASHLDTVSSMHLDVVHEFEDDGRIVGTDGQTTLGADDKAGVTIMLYMIENKIPGLYYFFIGEEVGCIGSGKVSEQIEVFNKENYDRIISFDRRGNESIITHQSKLRCASDAFGNALMEQLNSTEFDLNLSLDTGGVCTDSLEFIELIPECTNLSVGYMNEHTSNETQDLDFLERISKACVIIDWESLPTERDPAIVERKTYNHANYGHGQVYHDIDDEYLGGGRNQGPMRRRNTHSFCDTMQHRNSIICEYTEQDEEEDIDDLTYYNNIITDPNYSFDDIDTEFNENEKMKPFYESLFSYFIHDDLTEGDVRKIKKQFLDRDNPDDEHYYNDIDSIHDLKY